MSTSGSSSEEPALVAVQFAQPPLPAIVAVLARPLDAEHFAGEGIDDDAAPIFVDVDLDVAGLGKAQWRVGWHRGRSRRAGRRHCPGAVDAAASTAQSPASSAGMMSALRAILAKNDLRSKSAGAVRPST